MLIPYRVKNPPKRFPAITVTIIAVNVLVYACTSEAGLVIKESAVQSGAFALGVSPLINALWAMFLHADPLHLLGNMLFLWVFGPPVEDRLGVGKYLIVYFATGFAGDVLQALLDVLFGGHPQPGIGASGCIMGVVGAYWYLFSWSTVCVFYWLGWFWRGVWEVQAIWIIGLYILMDLAEGMFFGSMGVRGGVANFCHVGGGVTGALLCIGMGAKRDSEAVSEAKAIQADMKDLSMLPAHALQTMLEADPDNLDLIRALAHASMGSGQRALLDSAIARAGVSLVERDPSLVAMYLLDLRGDPDIYKPVHLLRLAGALERSQRASTALSIYHLIAQRYPDESDAETAYYRMASCHWKSFKDVRSAHGALSEMAKRFPNGQMLRFGQALWNEIQAGSGSQAGPR